MKKSCAVCGEKASIWTRIRLKDGFLCNSCAKRCSEHLDDFYKFSASEIIDHLNYRKENAGSDRLKNFSPTISLGEYEILRIDEISGCWLLKTEKRFNNNNPDIFRLSQITDVEFICKKECLNRFDEDTASKRAAKKLKRRKNRCPIYGYWFYVVIKLNHPYFDRIDMRINKYIISEKNQIDYIGALRNAQNIVEAINEMVAKTKNHTDEN